MGLSKKQKQNAERLKAALDKYDKQQDAEALQTAKEMGDAAKAGDEDKLAGLVDKARRKGWA